MKKIKKAYCVVAHRIDCGDETVFQVENNSNKDWFSTKSEARKAMKEDYQLMIDAYYDSCEVDGNEDKFQSKIEKDEIFMNIPIWNSETEKEDWILCHWKIVEI